MSQEFLTSTEAHLCVWAILIVAIVAMRLAQRRPRGANDNHEDRDADRDFRT